MPILKNAVVEKRNVLNETKTKMSLQELRLLAIYLSRINARDESTRCVRFGLDEFLDIIGYKNKVSIPYIKSVADKMLAKLIDVPVEEGGYKSVQVFKNCFVNTDGNGAWFVELDCHDDALPLLFNFKREYFTYKLNCVLALASANQFRLYEILKQRENFGEFLISIGDLRKMLGLKTEYSDFYDFKRKILVPAQKTFEKNTDICFSFEPGCRGAKGVWKSIKFRVWDNPAVVKNIDVDTKPKHEIPSDALNELENEYTEDVVQYAELCNWEFSQEELRVIADILYGWDSDTSTDGYIRKCDIFTSVYHELERKSKVKDIHYRFGYFKKLLEAAIKQ